jgi:hypothetical protein
VQATSILIQFGSVVFGLVPFTISRLTVCMVAVPVR